ncbi:retinol dehydrogenase 11-like [Spodoptera litura]|uniref:Retinol dehydrogenase 11-like n=1 Tax=Spodoptera litura TaxID=69820 RepID=A0A9J7IU32_SPOLT|nr:retinol dehydrogenase 11-like [Spodoptera litura]
MDNISGWCHSKRRLEGSTVVVTGGNAGIGKETVLDLYKRGSRVIMACRNVEKANAAKEEIEEQCKTQEGTGTLVVEQLDLCRLESVRAFVRRVAARERSLRALLCNAGVMMCPLARTEDGFETHIASNHLAHALLALLLLPLLIRDSHSRIVFVSSMIHELFSMDMNDINFIKTPYGPLQAYANSKIANILFAKALDLKLKEHNIKGVSTYSLHPGIVKTGIARYFPEAGWLASIANYLFHHYLLSWCWKTPRCGAQTSIYCVVDEKCENESGLYYSDCAVTTPSRQCRSVYEAEKLWNITIDMLNLRDHDIFGNDASIKHY